MRMLIAVLLLSSSGYAAENRVALKLFANNTLTDITVQGTDRDGKTGLGVGVEYLRQVAPRVSVGAEIDQLGRSENTSGKFINHVQGTVSGSMLAAMAVMRLDLNAPDRPLRPYVSAGAGLAVVSLKASAKLDPGYVWTTGGNATKTLVDSSAVGGVFTLRAGADLKLSESWSLGGEIGYVRTSEVEHQLTSDGKSVFGSAGTIKGPEASVIFGGSLAYRF